MPTAEAVGSWAALTNAAPDSVSYPLLLTDGTVIFRSGYKLTPDSHGSYLNGTWALNSPKIDGHSFSAMDVLRDGRAFICGGEYGNGFTGEVYDPLKNIWTHTALEGRNFLDSLSALLPDGRVLMGASYTAQTSGTPIYDPVTDTWSAGAVANFGTGEGVWLKMGDGSILHPGDSAAERYIPSLNQWVMDAPPPATLFSGGETGSGYLLPDGRAIFLGYYHTDIYTPDPGGGNGTWVAGPDIPDGMNCGDNPGVMMNNGIILLSATAGYLSGTNLFYEYDPATNTFTSAPTPPATGGYGGMFLNLPDGTVLYCTGNNRPSLYTPGTAPLAAAKPAISDVVHNADGSYTLAGTLLTGITEGAAYGDDAQASTNYPLVRLTSGTNVYYAKTFNWSTTNMMTGNTPVSTQFSLPPGLPSGTYSLVVSTNGIASTAVSLTVPSGVDAAPTVATAASSSAAPVTGLATNLSVLGADSDGGGESKLTYTWAAVAPSNSIASPSFSINGTNAAKNTTATFYNAGNYVFKVYITDSAGLFASSTVNVTVNQALTSVAATPDVTNLTAGQTKQLSAKGYDQFGSAMVVQPSFTWSLSSGGGSVNASGLYTSPATGTIATAKAATGAFSDTAGIYVVSTPWISLDVGGPSLAGSGSDGAGTFTNNGAGKDVGGTSDQFHYVYRKMDGDGTIIARVATQDNTAASAKSGVMIRNSLDPADQYAFMLITPENGSSFQYRSSLSASAATKSTAGGITTPYWVKLVRSGNTFNAYRSPDGSVWTSQGSVSIAMGATTYVGLAVCSKDETTLNTSSFDNVAVTTAANDSLVATPGVPATINVVTNDAASSGALTVTGVTQGAKGTVVNNGDGTVTYTAAGDAIGQDGFSYTVADSKGNTASAFVLVKLNITQVWFPFEEGSGTLSIDRISSLQASLSGSTRPTWSTGVQGSRGLTFNGSTGYVSVPAMNLNSNTVTLAGWVKRSGTQSSYAGLIFSRAGSTVSGLHFGTGNELRYTWNNSSATYNWSSGLVPPDGTWTFVAVVITPSNATIYMKPSGGSMTSATNVVANTVSAFDGATCIGQDSAGVRFFKGSMDEVRIFNSALTSAQIAVLASPTLSVATNAAAAPNPVNGTTADLSVLGASSAYAESTLSYNWSVTSLPAGATAPVFSANGTNAAKNATVTFSSAGTYVLSVTISDGAGATITSGATVTVNPVFTSIAVTPASATITSGDVKDFNASACDQFGNALGSQPSITWSVIGGYAIDTNGRYTAPYTAAATTVKATSGSISGSSPVTVTNASPTIAVAPSASPSIVKGTTTNLSVVGADADGGGAAYLTYTWAATTVPPGAASPTFSTNGTEGAKSTVATFSALGSYVFTVTVTDRGGSSVSGTVNVSVQSVATWTNVTGGSWGTPSNWLGGVIANGTDVLADFSTLNLSSDAVVTLDGARTVGSLVLADTTPSHNWIFNTGSGGPLTLDVSGGAPTIIVNNRTSTLNVVLAGSKGLAKAGAGNLTLGGANTYSGDSTITPVGDTTAVTAAHASAFGSSAVILNGVNTYSPGLSVNTGLTIANGLTLKPTANRAVLGLNGTANWSGNIIVDGSSSAGLAVVQAGGASAASPSKVSGNISHVGSNPNLLALRSSGVYGSVTGAISYGTGTVQLLDSTNWQFSNSANAWGMLDIANGGAIAYVGATNALAPSGIVSSTTGGTLRLSNLVGTSGYSQSIAGLNGNVKVGVSAGSATLTLHTSSDQSSSGVISGAVSLVKSGIAKQTLSGANTFTGTTTVTGGILSLTGSLGSGALVIQNGGSIEGTGTIGGAATVQVGGAIAPGVNGIGTLTVNNALTLSGTVRMEISKTGTLLNADKVAGLTTVTYGGALLVTALGPDPLAAGDTFQLFSAANRSGSFATLTLPALPAGLAWDSAGLSTSGSITVIQAGPMSAYESWQSGIFASGNGSSSMDADGDGMNNLGEFGFDTNPKSGNNGARNAAKPAVIGGEKCLVLTLAIRNGARFSGETFQTSDLIDGVVYRIEASADFSNWNLGVAEVTGTAADPYKAGLPVLDDGWSYRCFRTTGNLERGFLRAKVAESPVDH